MLELSFPRRTLLSAWLLLSPALGLVVAEERGIADFPKLSATSDWPWWRGPLRNGVADPTPVPTKLSPTENVLWKAPVPGRGHSSPIVVGDQVFLTTADEAKQVQSIVTFHRQTGKPGWKVDVNRGGFPAKNHPKNTEASPSIACDGERLFATFYNHEHVEAAAFDMAGKPAWKKVVAPFNPRKYEYGYAPSPLIYQDLVIIATEYDGASAITALNRTTGKEVWKTPRPNNITFSSPVVGKVAGRDQLLISGAEKVASYNPADGKLLWETPGTTFATCGTMIWEGDIVFASGGYPKAETLAVRADGSGKVLWRNNQKCYEQSMIVVDGHVYGLTDNGVLYCWRASDGAEMWKERLKGPVSASPVLAGGNIYWANELGTLYVFKPNPQRCEIVAENQIETESFASPAVCGGQIFLRVATGNGRSRQESLYCFGAKP
jgi:outer membrane protein assembly factor BamB